MAGIKYKRTLTDQGTVDGSQFEAIAFDVLGGGKKKIEIGPYLELLGELSSARDPGIGAQVRVFNTDTAVHYVAIGDASVAAPTGGGSGIPVPPQSYVSIATGPYQCIISDSNKVFGYKMVFDSTLTALPIKE